MVLTYVGPRARHFTGYCCWFDVGPRARHVTGYCCWLMWGLGQRTLLGIVVGLCAPGNTLLGIAVGLCGTSGNTPYWVLFVVGYVAPRATHFTGYCCCFTRGLGEHTLLGIVLNYARFWAAHFTGQH
jgi:hypothetical protein